MVLGGLQMGIVNNLSTLIIVRLMPGSTLLGISIYQTGLIGSSVIISKLTQHIINPLRIKPSIVHNFDQKEMKLYDSSVYKHITDYMYFFVIFWVTFQLVYKSIMPIIKPSNFHYTSSYRNIETEASNIRKSNKFWLIWFVLFLISSIAGFYTMNISNIGFLIQDKADMEIVNFVAGVALCLGPLLCGVSSDKVEFKSMLMMNICCLGFGSFLFCMTCHIGTFWFYLLLVVIYLNIGACCFIFSSCCIMMYGPEIGKRLQPIFLLIWVVFGVVNFEIDSNIRMGCELKHFGLWSLGVFCVTALIVNYKLDFKTNKSDKQNTSLVIRIIMRLRGV